MLERWNPVAEAERMLSEMNRLMAEVFERPLARARALAWRPATDVYETGDALVIRLAVPGARPEDLEVTAEQNVVTIRGQYGYRLSEEEAKQATWYRREIVCGEFAESVTLPVPVKIEEAKATVEHGIITLTFPKAEEARVKRIPIQVAR
ncbi:Hsp20/alpha crystallin family protein [Thermomicrobium sp. CFH 73360]|uniref:Hsp20/alpha crystallin family protein n=1 Tax=Thermomicrobium sp. CFH 73360 TaxID=2951987 RepID=UPI0020774747|nr:Hsp20/alpha crystallin family protein [Thermomicrobium sp. CFH 73360]MCM8746350.1 Hsp20/alpha crystallin family protein [Thermomicrobium sp. CFH 73360]